VKGIIKRMDRVLESKVVNMESLKRKIEDEINENDKRNKKLKKELTWINEMKEGKKDALDILIFKERKQKEELEKEIEERKIMIKELNEKLKRQEELRKVFDDFNEEWMKEVGSKLELRFKEGNHEEIDMEKKIIYKLPNEIVGEIFENLKINDKVNLGATCKWMNNNYLVNLIKEDITIETINKKEWYTGENGDIREREQTTIIIMEKGEVILEYDKADRYSIIREYEKS
jgi:hypothetical protein